MPGDSYRGELPPADDALESLAVELRRDVAHLAEEIGERNLRNRPHELLAAADHIEAEFTAAGHAVTPQEYQVDDCKCRNLEVEIRGSAQPDEIVVVGAHYDTVIGTPGANDNTSGIAALLALARRFSGRQIERTLRFVAFVNEEKPYAHTDTMGSRVYSRRCAERAERITAMLSLETIGYYDDRPGSQKYPRPFGVLYPSEGNFIAFVGNIKSRKLIRQVVAAFRRHEQFPSEGAALPAAVYGVGFSDHWSFWQEGYPALMVTDTAMFRYPYYHHPEDTTDKLDFDRLARVVRGLEAVVTSVVCD
ncbi:MAG: M28 family peptidase [Pirellulaceae bacterium]|nr:M28 family peptidase [Pirellulaceae bacterium]